MCQALRWVLGTHVTTTDLARMELHLDVCSGTGLAHLPQAGLSWEEASWREMSIERGGGGGTARIPTVVRLGGRCCHVSKTPERQVGAFLSVLT